MSADRYDAKPLQIQPRWCPNKSSGFYQRKFKKVFCGGSSLNLEKRGGENVEENAVVLKCSFPACGIEVKPEEAHVPSIGAIRQAVKLSTGKDRPINSDDLALNVHCKDHTAMGRAIVRMYLYTETLAELMRRATERVQARDHFAKYALPEPKQSKPTGNDSMKSALKGAGFQASKPNGKAATVVA
jgi:hypothetical protein